MAILVLIILLIIILKVKSCHHVMVYRGYKTCYDEHRNLMYSKRKYQCSTCDHVKWVDTRYGDPFSKV